MYGCSVCMFVCYLRAWCQWRPEKGVGYPGTGVTEVVSYYSGDGKEPGSSVKSASALNH